MPSKGSILNVTKKLTADFRHKNDSYEVLFHDFFKLNQSRGCECLMKGDKSQKMMEFRLHCKLRPAKVD